MRTVHFGSNTPEFKASCIIAADKSWFARTHSVLWNVREWWKLDLGWKIIFLFPWAVTKESATSGVTLSQFVLDGFICSWKERADHLTLRLPSTSSLFVFGAEYVSGISARVWVGFQHIYSKCKGTHMRAGSTVHTHTHRHTCCLQLSHYGSSCT